jgi:endonuclease/exonuclease/phosphatase family metal-dependent hydrolase
LLDRIHQFDRGIPTILAGDFNIPLDSTSLEPIRADYQNALEHGHNGQITTWPSPFPLLAIDHIWLNQKLVTGASKKVKVLRSDHAMVISTFSIAH